MATIFDDDSAGFLSPPPSARRRLPVSDADTHPLLAPLVDAQDAVARLETLATTASAAVADGLRARIAYREAAGWLAHTHTWIHPRDLALRDAGTTGSYAVAALAGRLDAELPTMTTAGSRPDVVPSDQIVGTALRLARLWRRLAEHRTWRPVADVAAVRGTLDSLGWPVTSGDAAIDDWLEALGRRDQEPALIRSGRGARDWMNRQGHTDPLAMDGLFLAACLWRENGFGHDIPLPFWSAPAQLHHRLSLRVGTEWLAGFLACVTAAARAARDELAGLQRAETAGASLMRTARSQLPRALDHVLRSPVVTARGLADHLRISPQAALGLLRQLVAAGVVREATSRAAWRAFTTA
jgi:HTH DNA binding domain